MYITRSDTVDVYNMFCPKLEVSSPMPNIWSKT